MRPIRFATSLSASIGSCDSEPATSHLLSKLGMSKSLIFTKIILPVAKRGIYAGLLICFARSISEFGATIVVAGNMPGSTENLSTSIYSSIASLDTNSILRLSSYSAILAILSISIHNYLLSKLK